jgi:predicted aspartyl protease
VRLAESQTVSECNNHLREEKSLLGQVIRKIRVFHVATCILVVALCLEAARAEPIQVGREVVVQASVNKSEPVPFCLDTGFSGSVAISEHFSKRLGLTATGSTEMSDPSGRSAARVPIVRLGQLSIGEIDRFDIETAVQKDGPMGTECEGVVGLLFFKGRLLTIDMENQRLEVATGALRPTDPDVLPYTSRDGIPQLTIKAGDSPIAARIDTGAPGFSLPSSWASKLHLGSPLQVIGVGRTVSGEFKIRGAVVDDKLSIGPYRFKGSFVEFNSQFREATIGLSVLRHFSLTFDQQSGLVRLHAPQRDITIAAPRMDMRP